jgi:hypothetical protein
MSNVRSRRIIARALRMRRFFFQASLRTASSQISVLEIAPEPTGHGLPLGKCEAYNRVYDQCCGSS